MIDGFKLRVTDYPSMQRIFHNPDIDFRCEVSRHTGEAGFVYRARYATLRIEYIDLPRSKAMFIRGSLPQYHTGRADYANIALSGAWRILAALVKELGLDIYATQVIKLEWGVNLSLPQAVPVNTVLSSLLVYKGKLPSRHVYEKDGVMYVIDLEEFSIKLYNKSAQHAAAAGNLMRYELHITRKSLLNRMNIHTISDLYNKRCITALHTRLLQTLDHLLFCDRDLSVAGVPARSKAVLLQYSHSEAWSKLMQSNGELYRKKKKSFHKQVTAAMGRDLHQVVKQGVAQQSEVLLAALIKAADPLEQYCLA